MPTTRVYRLLCATDDPAHISRLVQAVDSRVAIGHVPLERPSAVAAAVSRTGWDALAVLTASPESVDWPMLTHVCRAIGLPIVWSDPTGAGGAPPSAIPALAWDQFADDLLRLGQPAPTDPDPTGLPLDWPYRAGDDATDAQAILDRAVDFLVPAMADMAGAVLIRADDTVEHLALRERDPAATVLVQALWSQPAWLSSPQSNGLVQCAVSGRTLYVPQVPPHLWSQFGIDAAMREVLEALDLRSIVAAPFRTAAGQRGAVAMLNRAESAAFGPDMIPVVEELAMRTGLALDRQEHLAAVVATSQRYQAQADRNQRLLTMAGKLASLRQLPEAATAMIEAIRDEFPQAHVALWTLSEDGRSLQRVGRTKGTYMQAISDAWEVIPTDQRHSVTDAVTSGRSVTVSNREDLFRRYPDLAAIPELVLGAAWASIPLIQGGNAIGALGIAFDVARSFAADDLTYWEALALQCAQAFERARLYSRLSETLEENAGLIANLQQADRHKNTFLAMLAHELRNPLGATANALYLLTQSSPSPTQQQRALAIMDRQIAHLRHLLDDLIDLARITQGKISLDCQPVDLAALLPEAIGDWLAQQADAPTLERHLPTGPVWVLGDRNRLVQILNNLLDNAHKFSPGGRPIVIHADGTDGRVTIRVTDHGLGMTSEQMATIFEPFTQLGPTHQGLGLGLTLVDQLLKLHGGLIEVYSDGHGRGSSFRVCLPQIPAPPTTDTPAATATPPHALRILVVEDHADARETLAELLAFWGHKPVLAECGQQALDLAETHELDVALVDIHLPDVDGYQVAQGLRASKGASLPLIALTGFSQSADRQQALAAGFNEHVTKPLNADRLKQLLHDVCPVPVVAPVTGNRPT